MENRKIHNRIAVLRKERGTSRKELADSIGVNIQTVGYLEREEYNPSLDLAFRISDFFNLPIDIIFSTEPLRPLSEELLSQRFSPYSDHFPRFKEVHDFQPSRTLSGPSHKTAPEVSWIRANMMFHRVVPSLNQAKQPAPDDLPPDLHGKTSIMKASLYSPLASDDLFRILLTCWSRTDFLYRVHAMPSCRRLGYVS